jgi:hypothetical protein
LSERLFGSFFLGGFECSTHCRPDGTRLDLIAATCHDNFALADYRRLQSMGMNACRDGFRWHLVGRDPECLDFTSALPLVRAARDTGIQVIWDLLHYGWPDRLDVFSARFVREFAAYCRAAARLVTSELDGIPWFSVVNEPSFLCWAGAHEGFFPPFVTGRGHELKKQLIRCTIEGIEAIRDVAPYARFIQVDPLIHIVTSPDMNDGLKAEAAGYREAQFECTDMLTGRLCPELGGQPKYLDVIGCNYYVHNQRTDPRYVPLSTLLGNVWNRYQRPLLIAETGIEDERRPEWLRYVSEQVRSAIRNNVPVHGICLYPVMNHPGWADDRHCHNGLWDYCNADGHREIYTPLACELLIQQERFREFLFGGAAGGQRETAEVCA